MKTNAAKICVPVCVSRASEIVGAMKRAAEVGDLIELRLDYLQQNERDAAMVSLLEYLNRANGSIILTLRSPNQGGQTSIDDEARRRFWRSLADLPTNCFADLELDLVNEFARADQTTGLDWRRVICSHHDFNGVPADLEKLYERLAAKPARFVKIAVQANDAMDCIPIFRLLERAQSEGREMIVIAMGPAGIMTRILGPSRGSFLTYGSLDDESATAPGQLTAREMREIYGIDRIDRETEIFGIIGKPVSHSLSPHIHNAAFEAAKLNAVYIPFEVGEANEFIRRMVQPRSREIDWNLRGLSVTAPHKLTVMNRLDWIEPSAREMQAVNTIVVRDDELHGYNTDAIGLISPLRGKFGSLQQARCAIIGAGGAARAASWALNSEGAQVSLFARDPALAEFFARQFSAECKSIADANFNGFDVVINATPLGTCGERENETPVTAEQLRGVRLAYDLVYNPLETRFLREARAAGCETLSGLEMLIAQAVEQFKLWTGREPDAEVMRAAALRKLVQKESSF
jgi:3-dehydroquinate dehydratase/shikimate dehydrogenase